MSTPVVFVNIGWMKWYQGHTARDPLRAKNFSYFKKFKIAESKGHEQWNFQPRNGVVFGYVPRSARININRLGATSEQTQIDGVLVVFVARDPIARVLKIDGWYENATVARGAEFKRRYGKLEVEAPIKATKWHVVPVVGRDHRLVVPTAQKEPGGIGQSPIWYASKHPGLVARVRALVNGSKKLTTAGKRHDLRSRSQRQNDVQSRLEIERRSMRAAMDYFDDAIDVSKLARGWDIEASGEDGDVYIEVKGCSGTTPAFDLTPREYEMLLKHKARYVLFVMTAALSAQPVVRVFRFDSARTSAAMWISENREILELKELVGARARISSATFVGH